MKKLAVRTIIIISVIYLIISSIYTFFYKAAAQENLEITENSVEKVYNETFETNIKEQTNINQRKTIEMLDINISILILSLVLGSIISLIIEAKENSKVKYVLYFIFGNIIYNLLWMVIVNFIVGRVQIRGYYFINSYLSTMKQVFIPYILLYIIFITINILINKSKVKELNETLEGKKENNKKKYIKYIIITIIAIILIILLANIGTKTYILIKYSAAIEKFNKNTNYYVEDIFEESKIIYYYKDGILKEKSGENEYYYDEKEKKSVNILKENKALVTNERYFTSFYTKPVYNHFFGDDNKRIWSNIIMSFEFNLKIENIEGISYYVLERGYQKFYIDKDTFLLKRVVSIGGVLDSETGTIVDKENITDYVYKINVVTDEETAIPDLSNYEIYTNMEELVKSYKK